MKRLLLLLLIPTLSYSQITYEDIMSIDTTDSFIRVMIENGYEKGASKKGCYSILDKIIKTGSKIAINISEKI